MTTSDSAMTPAGMPLGMAPAPAVQLTLTPCDLGEYLPQYAGWCVVCDPASPLGANTLAAMMADTTVPAPQRMKAMEQWVATVLLYWNFTMEDPQTHERIAVPQPREGGAAYCPEILFQAIARAHTKAVNVPNASGSE